MTVAATTNRKTYTGDNVTTSFATSPVIFYLSSNLQVRITVIATGVSTLLTENTHYTVSGGSSAGAVGTVSLAGGSSPHGALLSTEKLVILRVLPLTQAADLVNNNNSDAEVLESALDKLTDVDQQLSERQDRALTFPEGDVSGSTTTLQDASTRAGRILGFDALGILTTLAVTAGTSLVSLAASTGASLIGFIATGVGAVVRTLLAKERDIVSAKDYGAVGDGVTDDTAALTAAFAAASTVFLPIGTYVCATRLNIPVNLIGPGTLKSTAITSGGDFGITGNNVTIRDITFVGSQQAGGQILFSNVASMDSLHLDHIKVMNTIGGATQIGIQINTATPARFSIVNSDVVVTGFAVLVNGSATNGASVLIANNRRIYSEKADGVNINSPGITFNDVMISGSNIESSAATGEFAISVAGTKNVTITGNTVVASKLEAIHIEDAQNNVVVTSNSLRGCVADGVRILNNSNAVTVAGSFVVGTAYTILVVGTTNFTLIGASANTIGISFIATGVGAGTGTATANPGGIIVSNNQIRAAAGNVSYGVNIIFDGSGSVEGNAVNGNHIYGFQRGIGLGFGFSHSCEGNVVENATDAYFAVGNAVEPANCQHSGVNYARNCTNLVVLHNHGTFGKVISSTPPTAIMVKEVVTNSPAMGLGHAFPTVSLNHGGAGAQLFTMFRVGDTMNGRITLTARFPGSVHTANYMADILWNGAALTINNPYMDLHGDFTAATVAVNAGNLQMSITSAVAHNAFVVAINFDGQYWKL